MSGWIKLKAKEIEAIRELDCFWKDVWGGARFDATAFALAIQKALYEKNNHCTIPATPTKADGWIKRSERLPEESDGDCDGTLWVYDKALSKVEISDAADVNFIADYTHWMPTDLVRPEPPQEQGRGDKNDKN